MAMEDLLIARKKPGRAWRSFDVCRAWVRSTPNVCQYLVRADGIEPTRPAWKAGVLPLNYARVAQEDEDLFLSQSGQARNLLHRTLRSAKRIPFSPGFYPVADCSARAC